MATQGPKHCSLCILATPERFVEDTLKSLVLSRLNLFVAASSYLQAIWGRALLPTSGLERTHPFLADLMPSKRLAYPHWNLFYVLKRNSSLQRKVRRLELLSENIAFRPAIIVCSWCPHLPRRRYPACCSCASLRLLSLLLFSIFKVWPGLFSINIS